MKKLFVVINLFFYFLAILGRVHHSRRSHHNQKFKEFVTTTVTSFQEKTIIDACSTKACHIGRTCSLDAEGNAECVCGGEELCADHVQPVCATDGRVYPSHCELHRVACHSRKRIRVDHSGKKCSNSRDAPSQSGDSSTTEKCDQISYESYKKDLVRYFCSHSKKIDCTTDYAEKQRMLNELFVLYDKDVDDNWSRDELASLEKSNHLDRLSDYCTTVDLLKLSDQDSDLKLTARELFNAFGMDEAEQPKVSYTTVINAGSAVELKCDVNRLSDVTWKRNGHVLETSDVIKVYEDDSLYIGNLGVHHIGNYTCHVDGNEKPLRTHVLLIQEPPIVKVYPADQKVDAGSTASVSCQVEALPRAQVTWTKNGRVIKSGDKSAGQDYELLHNNLTIKIHSNENSTLSTSTVLKCNAQNSAGKQSQSSQLKFLKNSNADAGFKAIDNYMVFHSAGYTVFDVSNCHVEHFLPNDFDLAALIDDKVGSAASTSTRTMCGATCHWSNAVVVGNEFVYVGQSDLKRIVVVELKDRTNPIKIIELKSNPLRLIYLKPLDELWVVTCEGSCRSSSSVLVLTHASRIDQLSDPHALTLDDDVQMSKVFVPKYDGILSDRLDHGYTYDRKYNMLHKIHLDNKRIVRKIDLKNCYLEHLDFIPIGGFTVVSCKSQSGSSFHVILDYITDELLVKASVGGGKIFVSPDSRKMVVMEGDGSIVSVYSVAEDGELTHMFDEYTQLQLLELTFVEDEGGQAVEAFAVSATHDTVLRMNLTSGRVMLIEDVNKEAGSAQPEAKRISKASFFSDHVVVASKSQLQAVSIRHNRFQCSWPNVNNASAVLSLAPA